VLWDSNWHVADFIGMACMARLSKPSVVYDSMNWVQVTFR
jgi:hypothetical protein